MYAIEHNTTVVLLLNEIPHFHVYYLTATKSQQNLHCNCMGLTE